MLTFRLATLWPLLTLFLLFTVLFACRKDIQLENEDGQISIYNGQATDRLITPEIADFIDSIPPEFVNREQRVITLMVYEEIKRLNPTIANFGQPVWPATYSFPSGENEMHINMTPFVTY